MIKKILDWILGKNNSGSKSVEQEAPYKIDAPTQVALQKAHDEVVASGQPDDSKGLEEAIAIQAAQPIVETAPVTVKAKYKKAELNKKTKKELLELAAQHGLEVKSRSTKEELVKILVKV
jgi:hypothetical protein